MYWDRHHQNAFPLVPAAKQDRPDKADAPTQTKKRTLPGLQRTTPAKHIISFHMSSKTKRQPKPRSSIKKSSTAARKQTPKCRRKQLFGGFTDDNVEVPLSYSPKTCKSHDDSSANIGLYQSNIDPNYKEAQELLASNGLGDFLPKLQALVNRTLLSECVWTLCGFSPVLMLAHFGNRKKPSSGGMSCGKSVESGC